MKQPLIELKNITKRFGDRTILDRVNLSIFEGQTTTIIGKSGVGKSVTLKHIIGLLEPDEGQIFYSGVPLGNMKRQAKKTMMNQFSYMFQNNALFDSMTVFENVAMPLREKRVLSKDQIQRRVLSKIEQLELGDITHQYPSQISGGMQKRVALARALITEPKIVLFDEPTTGLDPIRKNAVLGMVAHYRKQFNFTAIVVSHDIPDVFFISDRIAILYDEKIIFQGNPAELDQFDHPVIEEFINSLRSLKDELTGLESRRSFEKQYESEFGPIRAMDEFTIILVAIKDVNKVEETIGSENLRAVVQSLAALIEKHIGVMGLSARYSQNEILSILPHTGLDRAKMVLEELSEDLTKYHSSMFTHIQDACHGFSICAGMAQGKPGIELNQLVTQAKSINGYQLELLHAS